VRSPAEGWIELTAPSRDEYLDRIAELLDRLAGARLDQGTLEDVKLAVCEVVQNAMEWGNMNDARRKVRVSYGLFEDEIVLKVEDEGPGFDASGVPDARADPVELIRSSQRRSGKRLGGLGLFVARKLMDSVMFNEPGNVALLTKRLRPVRPASEAM